MADDHRTPFLVADEKTTLLAFLDYLRDAVIRKATGVTAEAVRRPMVDSGTNLLGIVKHLTFVEAAWFQWSFRGADVSLPSSDITEHDTAESVIANFRIEIARSNETVTACRDLDELCAREGTAPARLSMRWVLVHMIEETGRHAGHADILRELIDGSTGR